ncbi:hypothetical protein A6E05_10835 [Aliivibrio sp. 1S165]|nr:hypothetical protein A6E05_10835 [Aliivibrio sp. 1S165]OCH35984.1 hypothetical protein A6E06_11565 [Aliivibrio sp. 1S175]
MQQIDLNDYYYGRLFCNLRDKYSQHACSYSGGDPWLFSQIADSKKAHTFRYEPSLNMAGVERFELPTRVFLWWGDPWLFSQIADSKKAHTFRYEPSLNMAGVERFELPTRVFLWWGGSAALFLNRR